MLRKSIQVGLESGVEDLVRTIASNKIIDFSIIFLHEINTQQQFHRFDKKTNLHAIQPQNKQPDH